MTWRVGYRAELLLVLLAPLAGCEAWHIYPDGTGDAPTIQAKIDSAECSPP